MTKEEEYELRFLVKELPAGLDLGVGTSIIDSYIPENAAHCYLRLRKKGSEQMITKKQVVNKGDLSHMVEYTIPLADNEFNALFQTPGKRLDKIRYKLELDEGICEIGVFEGQLKGLIIADFEFSSKESMDRFLVPSWVHADVTQEKGFAGGELCGKSLAQIGDLLSKYGI